MCNAEKLLYIKGAYAGRRLSLVFYESPRQVRNLESVVPARGIVNYLVLRLYYYCCSLWPTPIVHRLNTGCLRSGKRHKRLLPDNGCFFPDNMRHYKYRPCCEYLAPARTSPFVFEPYQQPVQSSSRRYRRLLHSTEPAQGSKGSGDTSFHCECVYSTSPPA